MIRPLFMTPDGKTPLPTKKYYDIFTFLITQAAFAFTVAPFILLSFSDTVKVWSRVHFYTLIAVAASFALFSRSLPFRKEFTKRQAARAPPPTTDNIEKAAKEAVEKDNLEHRQQRLRRESSGASSIVRKAPTLGIADDPEADIDEIVAEVKAEIEERRRRGSLVQGFDVKRAVQEKLEQFKRGSK
jgi:lysophospholipid acyltransferase